jgi:hypothetical protein
MQDHLNISPNAVKWMADLLADPIGFVAGMPKARKSGFRNLKASAFIVREGCHAQGQALPEFPAVMAREDDIVLTVEVYATASGKEQIHPIGWVFKDGSVWISSFTGRESAMKYRAELRDLAAKAGRPCVPAPDRVERPRRPVPV